MQHSSLQPLPRFVFLALGIHGLVAAGCWWWWQHADHGGTPPSQGRSLTWTSPADFTPSQALPSPAAQVTAKAEAEPLPPVATAQAPSRSAAPPEPTPRAIAIDPQKAQALLDAQRGHASEPPPPATDVSRFITVSKRDASPAALPGTFVEQEAPDSLEGAPAITHASVRLDEVDRAIINAFRRNWNPPAASTLSRDQRTAHMDVTVDRTGHVLNFKLARRSGSDEFDFSVIEAAHHLDKIDVQLPASYPQDHYEFQVHFHVE